jgi:hypothetical protein
MSGTPRGPISGGGGGDIIQGQNPFTPLGGAGQDGIVSLPQTPSVASKAPAPSTAPANVTAVRDPADGTVQSGGKLWMRKWKLSIGPPSGGSGAPVPGGNVPSSSNVPANQYGPPAPQQGGGIDLSLLDFEFDVEQAQYQPPWKARIKVWNPNQTILGGLASKELSHVYLEAGYQSPSQQYGRVFAGLINFYRHGRQNATDTFVELYATTYDTGVNAAVVNTWLPAGYQTQDAINAVLSAMTPYGITLGQMPNNLSTTAQPRGRLLFGMARDYLRDIARTEKANFFIDTQGRLHMLKEDDVLAMGSEVVPVLNSKTGLIDVPTRTMDGAIECHCLLNPAIVPGSQIHINNQDVAGFDAINVDALPNDAQKFTDASIVFKADGYYPVGSVRHQGQNRGNPWYSHIITKKAIPAVGPKFGIS